MRTFNNGKGAIRDTANGKADYSYRHAGVEQEHALYMMKCATLPDGSTRSMVNWWKGIPLEEGMRSLERHVADAGAILRGQFVYKERKDGAEYTHYCDTKLDTCPKNWKLVTFEESIHGAHFNTDVCILATIQRELEAVDKLVENK